MKKRYFVLAAFFLFNPVISVIDPFPDFIGYFLIMKAFSEASYVFDNAYETQMAFKKMAIISIFKFISMLILPNTDATMALVFAFSFAIIEVLFGITAFQHLFDVVSYICMRCEEDKHVSKSEKTKRFTIAFLLTRIICSTVPEFCALFLSDPQKEWMYRFRVIFLILFVAVATVVGLIWLVRFIRFFNSILTDTLKEKIKCDFYEEMKDRQSVFFSKDFIFAIGIMTLSMLFTIDFYIDKIEVISDMFLAPTLVIAFVFLIKKKHVSLQKYEALLFITLVVHFISSILNTYFYSRYNNQYLITSIIKNKNARTAYLPVQIFTILEAIAFLLIVILVLHLMKKYTIDKIRENPKFFSEYSVEGYLKEFSLVIDKKSRMALAFAIISTISSIAYVFVIPYNERFVVFNTFVAIIFFVSFWYMLSFVSDEIYKKILKYS